MDPAEAGLLLSRFDAQEARRRRNANRKLVFLGSSAELPPNPVQNQFSSVDSSIDLEVTRMEKSSLAHSQIAGFGRESFAVRSAFEWPVAGDGRMQRQSGTMCHLSHCA